MEIKRYIITQAVKTKQNELIPIWDNRIVFEKTDMYGNVVKLKDDYQKHFNLVECVYDLKTKQIEMGIELDYYPIEKDLEFKKGEVVYVEQSHRKLTGATIEDIVYEEFELEIKKGKKMDEWWVKRFKDIKIDPNALYAIKIWKPFYILDNGQKIEWEHQLYHKIDTAK